LKKSFKFLSIVIAILLIPVTGCKKDASKSLEEQLIGKWELQSISYEFYENAVKTGQQVDFFSQNQSVYEFIVDGVGNVYENGTLKNSLTWTLVGTSITIGNSGQVIKGDISIDNGILTLIGSDTSVANGINYEILKMFTFKKV
jgi:hypothetical protein